MEDRLQQSLLSSFQKMGRESKFVEYAKLLGSKGISNWDDGLIALEREDIIELGIKEGDIDIFSSEIKKRREEFREVSVKSVDTQSMVSYMNARKYQYTEEKLEHELSKLYEIYRSVNSNCFNQFPDLCKISFLTFIAQEKILFVGPSSTNIEEIFKQYIAYLDIPEQ